ncbi:MAG: hypothetical protein KJ559_03535 [Nanoarchaeota archaeon]|nr:hypothetical protein [Nanoarchaeota archaeon]
MILQSPDKKAKNVTADAYMGVFYADTDGMVGDGVDYEVCFSNGNLVALIGQHRGAFRKETSPILETFAKEFDRYCTQESLSAKGFSFDALQQSLRNLPPKERELVRELIEYNPAQKQVA